VPFDIVFYCNTPVQKACKTGYYVDLFFSVLVVCSFALDIQHVEKSDSLFRTFHFGDCILMFIFYGNVFSWNMNFLFEVMFAIKSNS
jgi:hypothetical protein